MKKVHPRTWTKLVKLYQVIIAVLVIAIIFELSKHLKVNFAVEAYGRTLSVELSGEDS